MKSGESLLRLKEMGRPAPRGASLRSHSPSKFHNDEEAEVNVPVSIPLPGWFSSEKDIEAAEGRRLSEDQVAVKVAEILLLS